MIAVFRVVLGPGAALYAIWGVLAWVSDHHGFGPQVKCHNFIIYPAFRILSPGTILEKARASQEAAQIAIYRRAASDEQCCSSSMIEPAHQSAIGENTGPAGRYAALCAARGVDAPQRASARDCSAAIAALIATLTGVVIENSGDFVPANAAFLLNRSGSPLPSKIRHVAISCCHTVT